MTILPLYFETLPLHPQPKRLESLSSYIMRIAEANGYDEIRTLYKLMSIYINKAEEFVDLPHSFFAAVSLRTACPEQELLATTLYHAGKKFGRSPQANVLSRFFNTSLGTHLRYCPLCLAESTHYPLAWRFLMLPGCETHRCRLLDRCGYCGSLVALFSIPAQVGVCPTCKQDLRTCQAIQLSAQEMQLVQQRTVDLEYLLAPQNWEEDDGKAKKIGGRLREMRKEKQYMIEQVAQDLGVSPQNIKALELATADHKVSFQTYVKYTDYLGVTLHSLFAQVFFPSTPPAQIEQHRRVRSDTNQLKQAKRQQREQDLLDQVKKASQDFKALGLPITLEAICKKVHIAPQNLKMYPSILAWWEEVFIDLRDEAKQRENELVHQVQQAILTLQAHGQVVSTKAICAYVHRSRSQLLFSPRVNLLIKQALGKKSSMYRPSNLPDENHILEEIQAAITFLKTSGQFLTQKAISKRVGLSLYMLQLYPQAKAILDQVAEEGRLQRKQLKELRGQEIAERVQQAIAQLKDSGQIVTQPAIAEIVGHDQALLRRYEPVRPLLSQIAKEYQQYISQRSQQHESALMEQMPRAIQYLQEAEQPITLLTVGKLLGFANNGLTYYPNLRRLYYQVVDEVRERQAQQREVVLLERIHHTIQQLKESNQPVRLKTLAESAGMAVASLLKYPRIKLLFQQITEERRKKKRETDIKQDQQLPIEMPEYCLI